MMFRCSHRLAKWLLLVVTLLGLFVCSMYTQIFLHGLELLARPVSIEKEGKLQDLTPDGISNRSTEHHSHIYQTSEQVFRARRERIEDVCRGQNVPGRIHGVFSHLSGALYCFVPKAGCTFWKRVFKAAHRKRTITKKDVFSISRIDAHTRGGGVRYTQNHNSSRFTTRFIVARDPFSRLLSSYLDKVYLPDFWSAEIVPMVKRRRQKLMVKTIEASDFSPESDFLRKHFNIMAAILDETSSRANMSTREEGRCGKYMTFAEFVSAGFDRAEPHWMPIHQICNPCSFNVTHLSRMETFTEDARFLLERMGIPDILDDVDDDVHVDEELKTIVEYNYNRVHRDGLAHFYNSCVSNRELAYRLWHNFQWRGYIDPDVKYKVPDFSEEQKVKDDLMAQIWLARKSGLENRGRMKAAKKHFKEQAYATITKQMFERLSKKYDLDFKLFGYEEIRDALYLQY